ncbi:Protein kinase superfamily protein [Klebsormidium nitens]|uniref:non-specific serine/threonine protein kinase n=1 Tax=Klebsormidium nitens TaxID=105231 RepID=A0A1Y1HR44_KLENI|nr:Protein kinase superfamily protein [Klebsormidium nitens]|eukprot:GAQ79649.1 Protein kinase superfamily protein [Klebsormidium nitens]
MTDPGAMEADGPRTSDATAAVEPPRGELLNQGAEARVFVSTYLGRPAVIKQRFSKKYRHPTLDAKLTSRRLTGEARSLAKARKLGVLTPTLYAVDPAASTLTLERVEGRSLKDLLLAETLTHEDPEIQRLAESIGACVARLHDGGLVHGDLTTSNILVRPDGQVVLIDFGLAANSTLTEDKGVDLYVLERAFLSAHSRSGDVFSLVLASYKKSSKFWSSVLNRFAEVRARGRKRAMVG